MPDPADSIRNLRPCLPKTKYPRVHLLLRTLLNRPELARHIKSAEVMSPLAKDGRPETILPFWGEEIGQRSGFTPKDFDLAEKVMKEMGLVSPEEWLDCIWKGRSDVILALLLSRLFEMRSLDIVGLNYVDNLLQILQIEPLLTQIAL